jgi:hypothetical protein
MSVSLTIFKSKYDNKTHKRMDFKSFSEFEKLLYELSKVRYNKKEDAPLISPATYVKGEKRRNVNVIDWGGWAALDVDNWKPNDNIIDELNTRFKSYSFIAYSTASSTLEFPKFRLVFPLTERVPADKIRDFWFALVTFSGFEADPQCKDLSRMYYVPADYHTSSNTNNFILSGSGDRYLSPYELIEKYPAPPPRSNNFFDNLPEDVQKQIIEHRKQKLDNTEISWSSYKDCPFWPKKLAAEYMTITGEGWYYKFYQIMLAIASNAIRKKYPITPIEIAQLCFEFDAATGGWYKNRNFEEEASRALEYVYRNS